MSNVALLYIYLGYNRVFSVYDFAINTFKKSCLVNELLSES